MVECHECGTEKPVEAMYRVGAYDTPWDEAPRIFHVCREAPEEIAKQGYVESCAELLEDTSWADFRYFTCPDCDRFICQQNPRNGWMVQFRVRDDEMICLRCYEQDILENGMPLEDFEENRLDGMFLDDDEVYEAGYRRAENFINTLVASQDDVEEVCMKAEELIAQGYKVVVGFESMAIGGLEGYITLWAKP